LRIFFTSVITISLFIFLEISSRIVNFLAFPDLHENTIRPVTLFDPILHHKYQGNVRVTYTNWAQHYTLITNSQGWIEEKDTVKENIPNTFRIFDVGDSKTESRVNMEEKMVELTEKNLNKFYKSTGKIFEIINTGTGSCSNIIY